MRRPFLVLLIASLILGGCGSGSYTPPTVVVTADEIAQIKGSADEYAALLYEAWPDIGAATDWWAEGIFSNDPTNDEWVLDGADVLVPLWRETFAPAFPNVEWTVEDSFLSVDGVAYRDWNTLWPPWIPNTADPRTDELDVWTFDDGQVTSYSLWFTEETIMAIEAGCFKNGNCAPTLHDLVDDYVDAWISGDPKKVAALYDHNAVFVDSLLGINATGGDEIAQQADTRFGEGDFTFEVAEVLVQTNGFSPPLESNPDQGQIFSVSIRYRIISPDGQDAIESITMFDLGTLESDGMVGTGTLNPDRLITREDVFHLHDSLLSLTD